MEIQIICVLTLLIIIVTILYIKLIKKLRASEEELKKCDKELTTYIAKNLDMEKRLSEIEKKYSKQQDMSKEIKNIQEQSRLLKHDMKNHTLVIMSYLDEGKIEEAKQYTSKILDNLNKMYTYINVGNSLLNYILNNKLSKAKELGIEIKAEIENLAFDYIESVDFSALLNNMLDNAIEACISKSINDKEKSNKSSDEKSKDKKRNLEIYISNQKGFDSIMIKNTIDESVLQKNPELNSSKKETGHGFGMVQIRKIVEKYNGMIDIYEEEKEGDIYFVVNVVYPN